MVGPPCTSGARKSASPVGAANDGCRLHVDHRVAPIEESGEQCEADASCVIHTSGFDTTLDIPHKLFAKNQILSADSAGRAQERNSQPQEVPGHSDDRSRQLQHALIMPESACVWRRRTLKCLRRELLRTTDLAAAAGHGAKHFFVFGHKPAYTYYFGTNLPPNPGVSGLDKFTGSRDAFWNVIEQYGATYFCGHEHEFNMSQPTGHAWQVLVGTGGSPFDAKLGEVPSLAYFGQPPVPRGAARWSRTATGSPPENGLGLDTLFSVKCFLSRS